MSRERRGQLIGEPVGVELLALVAGAIVEGQHREGLGLRRRPRDSHIANSFHFGVGVLFAGTPEEPEDATRHHDEHRQHRDLLAADALMPLVPVIPRERRRDRHAENQEQRHEAHDRVRPGERVADHFHAVQQRVRGRRIAQRPLEDLVLFDAGPDAHSLV